MIASMDANTHLTSQHRKLYCCDWTCRFARLQSWTQQINAKFMFITTNEIEYANTPANMLVVMICTDFSIYVSLKETKKIELFLSNSHGDGSSFVVFDIVYVVLCFPVRFAVCLIHLSNVLFEHRTLLYFICMFFFVFNDCYCCFYCFTSTVT